MPFNLNDEDIQTDFLSTALFEKDPPEVTICGHCSTDSLLQLLATVEVETLEAPHPAPPVSSTKEQLSPPKGYISAFNFFVVGQRPIVVAENPSLRCSNNTLNKILGEMWKALPLSRRQEYILLANYDKQRYLQELKMYNETAATKIIPRINPPPGFNINGDVVMDSADCGDNTNGQIVPLMKRPLTAYSLFAQQEKQFILGLECTELQRRMGRFFGIRWKHMDPEEKELYTALEEATRQMKN